MPTEDQTRRVFEAILVTKGLDGRELYRSLNRAMTIYAARCIARSAGRNVPHMTMGEIADLAREEK